VRIFALSVQKLSVSLARDHVYELKARVRLGEADSRSGALRQILDQYDELRTECETLADECEQLRTERESLRTRLESREDRIDELETQLAERSQIQEKIEDLPDKIRGGATYQERRQRLLDQASIAQRVKWRVTGVPVDQLTDDDSG
jgi:predicted nuclease with TOPRIM domain